MKYFLDTADIEEIKEAQKWGSVDGVTTNPTLLLRASYQKHELRDIYRSICSLVQGPVSLEVEANENTSAQDMVGEGRKFFEIARNVVVKIPAIPHGFQAIEELSSLGVPVNTTLVFRIEQALEAARRGAAYVSPFLGRFDDAGQRNYGIQLVREIREAFYRNAYDDTTQILAASIRHNQHVHDVVEAGANCITLPPNLFRNIMVLRRERRRATPKFSPQQLRSPLTDQGLALFNKDHTGLR